MTIRKNHFICTILLAFLILIASGCSNNDGTGYLFRYSLLGNPKILDPQLAKDVSSLVVIKNMYEGLLKLTPEGSLTEGMATNYTISDDSLEYTFNLRDDSFWTSSNADFSEKVTAYDFQFAFYRLFNKENQSPFAEDFICIKNAKKILDGEMDISSLGVEVISDFTIKFSLEYQNANFLSLLTTSPAMPCNENFFKDAKGKYGLKTEATASNGAFYVKSWEYDKYGKNNFIIMRKNKQYFNASAVCAGSLNFFIENSNEKILSDFITSSTDCLVTNKITKETEKGKFIFDEFETSTYGLAVNTNSPIFINKSFRDALSLSIDRNELTNVQGENLRIAQGIIPKDISMLNKSFRELISDVDRFKFDTSLAQRKWEDGLSILGKNTIDNIKILIPQSYLNPEDLKFITQQWQNTLGFFCGLEIVSDDVYNERLSNGEFDIALYNISCSYNSPNAILSQFVSTHNIFGYNSLEVEKLLENAIRTANLNESVKYFGQAEKKIANDNIFLPLFYNKEYLLYPKKIADILYNPFTKQVDFFNAKNFD